MTECEMLEALLAKFEGDGNTDAADAIRAAQAAAGCTVQTESGGTGNGPIKK